MKKVKISIVQVYDGALESRKKLEWSRLKSTSRKNGPLSQERQSRGLVHFYLAHGSSIPFRPFILTFFGCIPKLASYSPDSHYSGLKFAKSCYHAPLKAIFIWLIEFSAAQDLLP